MSERYATLFKCIAPQSQNNTPVLLTAGVLLGDKQTGSVLAQIKLQNISDKVVTAVYASLMCVDAMNMPVEPAVDARYLDLNVKPGEFFADRQPIVVPNTTVRSFTLRVTDIMFADGTTWQLEEQITYNTIPEIRNTYTAEQLQQLRIEMRKSELITSEALHGGLRRCCCGQWNQYTNHACIKCGTDFAKISTVSDPSVLTERYELRQKAEAEEQERARIAREREKAEKAREEEEAKRKREQQRQLEEKRSLAAKKKKKKMLGVFAALVALAAGVVFVFTQIIIPGNHYEQAASEFDNGMYAEAYDTFTLAGNYKDSSTRAMQSAYNHAQVLLQQGDYEQSYSYYQRATGFSDASEQMAAVALLRAQELHNLCDYQNASTWYEKAGATENATAMKNFHYATDQDNTWLHTDTREKYPRTLPDGVFVFAEKISTGKYSSETQYGVLKIGAEGWVTNRSNYSYVHYYDEYELILAGTDTMCTVIDLRTNSMADVSYVNEVETVSDDGIVCFHRSDSGYGYFDRTGHVFVEPIYQYARAFSEGFAAVRKDGLWGFIDNSGNEVIAFQYTDVESFSKGYAKVEMEEHRVKEGDLYVNYKEGWGLIDTSGKHVIEPNWYDVDYSEEYLSDGFVLVEENWGSNYGLLDLNNNIILEPIYDTIGPESEGLIYVRILEEGESYYPCTKAGWVDTSGRMVINLLALGIDGPREASGKFINGCAVIDHWKKDGRWSRDICDLVINSSGKILWLGEDGEYGYQNADGTLRIEGKYYKTENGSMIEITKSEYDRIQQQNNTNSWYTDDSSTSVDLDTPFYQQWADVASFSNEGIALVSLNSWGPYGFVTNDERLLVDAIYDDARSFANGYAIVKMNDKWGCIDVNGKTIIEPQYQLASSVSPDGTLFVQYDDGSYALINLNGEVIIGDIQAIDNSEGNVDGELPMPSSCVFIRTGAQSKWQLFDSKGNQIF